MRAPFATVLSLLLLAGAATAQSPSVEKHPASWLSDAKGNLFFCLNADGSQLLVNRSPDGSREELVVVPTTGGDGTVWHASKNRCIYDRIGLSRDGKTVVFARSTGSAVYVLTKAGATPKVVADVAPDRDPRQLRVSHDGKWVAFTAARIVQNGDQGRVHANLYVAATDGSALHRIPGAAIPDRYIPFDLSGDGKTVVWIDDATKGPLVAGVDGKSPRRIAVSPKHLGRVMCNADGSVIHFESLDTRGSSQLWRIRRSGSGETRLHTTPDGRFFLARGSGEVRLERFDPKASPPGSCTLLSGASPVKMFDFGRPDVVGTRAWSDDGNVFVWRALTSSGGYRTFVWRSGR